MVCDRGGGHVAKTAVIVASLGGCIFQYLTCEQDSSLIAANGADAVEEAGQQGRAGPERKVQVQEGQRLSIRRPRPLASSSEDGASAHSHDTPIVQSCGIFNKRGWCEVQDAYSAISSHALTHVLLILSTVHVMSTWVYVRA